LLTPAAAQISATPVASYPWLAKRDTEDSRILARVSTDLSCILLAFKTDRLVSFYTPVSSKSIIFA
jgi:hypothetical protein